MTLEKIKKYWIELTSRKAGKKWIAASGVLVVLIFSFILWQSSLVKRKAQTAKLLQLGDFSVNNYSSQAPQKEEYDFYNQTLPPKTNSELRDQILVFARQTAENYYSNSAFKTSDFFKKPDEWLVRVTLYLQGESIAQAESMKSGFFSSIFKNAVIETLESGGVSKQKTDDSRFLIEIGVLDGEMFSLVEHEGRAEEVRQGLIPVRQITREVLEQKIEQSKEYLFRAVHPQKGGVYKYYYPDQDKFDNSLRTTYSSTLLYSLLKINDFESDRRIEELIPKITDFIFSMQEKDKEKAIGAFHYSLDLEKDKKDNEFVVGTNSKTIYTLIKLYQRSGDKKYLDLAQKSADWLLTMQDDSGKMRSYIKYEDEKWHYSTKYSVLYNGQVLSALSRIYRVTGEEKYLTAARGIADNFLDMIEEQGCYVGG